MAIVVKRRRLVQPQYPAGVTEDPIGRLCQGLWYGSLTQDQVSRQAVARNSSGTITRNLRGLAYSVTGTGSLDRCVLTAPNASTTPGSGDFTAAVRFVLRNANGYAALARWYSGGSPSLSSWFLGANGQYGASAVSADFIVAVGSTSYTATVSTGWVVGGEYMLVGTRTGTTIKVVRYSYADGVWATGSTTNAGITTVNNVTARTLKLGEIDLGAGYNAQLDADFAAVFGRALSDDEIRTLVANPAVLAGKRRSIWVPVSAGATGTTVDVPAGALTLTGYAPTVSATANQRLAIPAGALTLTGNAPTVTTTANQLITVPAGTLTLTGYAPTVIGGESVPDVAQNRGVPGRWYTLHKGREVYGSREEIEGLLRQMARDHAEEDERTESLGEKPEKRRIRVVQPGRAQIKLAPKAEATQVSLPVSVAEQTGYSPADAQAIYAAAYRNHRRREEVAARKLAAAQRIEAEEREAIAQALGALTKRLTSKPATMDDLRALEARILRKLKQ